LKQKSLKAKGGGVTDDHPRSRSTVAGALGESRVHLLVVEEGGGGGSSRR